MNIISDKKHLFKKLLQTHKIYFIYLPNYIKVFTTFLSSTLISSIKVNMSDRYAPALPTTAPPTVPGSPANCSAPMMLFWLQKFTKVAIGVPEKQLISTWPFLRVILPNWGEILEGG